jgi:thymidylate synthase
MNIQSNNIDELLKILYKKIIKDGKNIVSTKGGSKEIIGLTIRLTNPLSRISTTEDRGKIFSAIGELLWYVSGNDNIEFIEYYIKKYNEFLDPGSTKLNGAYGKRIFKKDDSGSSLFEHAHKKIIEKNDSRQIVIPVYNKKDLIASSKDIPCTTTLQFLKRENKLNLIVNMRSNDAYIGLPHDIFCFTMIQEIMARTIGCELGEYIHFAGSMHIYENNIDQVYAYLNTDTSEIHEMPRMPDIDISNSDLKKIIRIEKTIRTSKYISLLELSQMKKFKELNWYWQDICRVFLFFKRTKDVINIDENELYKIKRSMKSEKYHIFMERLIKKKIKQQVQLTLI